MPERRARVREDGGNADDGGAVAKVTGTGTSARPCHAVVRCYGRMSSAGAGKTRGSSALVRAGRGTAAAEVADGEREPEAERSSAGTGA